MNNRVKIYGHGELECWNRDGSLAWRRAFRNAPTAVGLDYLANAGFTGGAQQATWYIGLMDLLGFSALALTDTMASHIGWRENVMYTGNRPTWTNAESGQQVSSNGVFTFPITGIATLHGLFVVSNNTLGGTSGILWATALLSSDAAISPGQSLTGNYTLAFGGS